MRRRASLRRRRLVLDEAARALAGSVSLTPNEAQRQGLALESRTASGAASRSISSPTRTSASPISPASGRRSPSSRPRSRRNWKSTRNTRSISIARRTDVVAYRRDESLVLSRRSRFHPGRRPFERDENRNSPLHRSRARVGQAGRASMALQRRQRSTLLAAASAPFAAAGRDCAVTARDHPAYQGSCG